MSNELNLCQKKQKTGSKENLDNLFKYLKNNGKCLTTRIFPQFIVISPIIKSISGIGLEFRLIVKNFGQTK